MGKIIRKYPWSKIFVQKEVAPGIVLFVPYVEDISDSDLRMHFEKAISEEDYEYAHVCAVEAQLRGYVLSV